MNPALRRLLRFAAAACWLPSLIAADAPFVSSFDRFAQHGEIDLSLAGRVLLSELNCTACHASAFAELSPKAGPNLQAVGKALQAEWVRKFLENPSAVKPGTTMPHILHALPNDEQRAAAGALTAFLMSQTKAFPEIKASGINPVPSQFWHRGNPQRGRALYHQIGCVACHEADPTYETVELKPSPLDTMLEQLEPDEIAELGLGSAARQVRSVPHANLPQKYTRQSLTHFLLNPASVRPGGRMPSLKLSAMDAAHVAAWLMERDDNTDGNATKTSNQTAGAELDQIQQGRTLFHQLRCHNCHAINDAAAPTVALPLTKLNITADVSCIAKPASGRPQYPVSVAQRDAITAAVKQLDEAATPADSEQLQLTLLKLNCYGCHERDQLGSVGRSRKAYFETVRHVDIGDEGRLPPQLSGVGRKLKRKWLKDVLHGKATVRPHMTIRMPEFPPSMIDELPALFAKVDHPEPVHTEQQVFGDLKGLTEDGRILMDVGCVQCHAFRGETLPGSVGVDLLGVANRVHPQWFRDFLENPGALKPRTRMPTFFPNGKSQVTDLQHGDMHRQIAAMWAYTRDLSRLPLPGQIERVRSHNFELDPRQRPIVLRTFMPVAGTHAIAVGFPEHTHFAFDAENVRFAEAWRGRFLDAEGTWFSRFTPPAEPLAETTVLLPQGVPIAVPDSANAAWPVSAEAAGIRFLGYRLMPNGVPVFLYRLKNLQVEDTIQPGAENSLVRTVSIHRQPDPSSPPATFLLHSGRQLQAVSPTSMRNEAGLTVTVNDDTASAATSQTSGQQTQWLLPIPDSSPVRIEVRYQW